MGGYVMGKVTLKYAYGVKDRYGKVRHYFRRDGKSVRLPGTPGSPDFMAAYAAALAGQAPSTGSKAAIAPGTFAALAMLYYGSPHFLSLSQTSRRNYRRIIDHFVTEHGHRRVDQMAREHVVRIVGSMAGRPGAAITLLKRLRTLTRFGLELGWIAVDPTHKVRSFRSKEIHTWTEDEIATFEARWPVGTKQHLAFALHLYTGQRGSDVHRMTWADIAGDTLRVVQQKTGAKLALALHPNLQAVLSVAPRAHMTIITTEYGKPFSVKGFGQFVSDAIGAAGLPARCKAHGLRKAAARRLAEAGCTAKQIMAVTGHKTLAEVERYTAAAEQEALSRQAIAKQAGNTSLQTVANRLKEVR